MYNRQIILKKVRVHNLKAVDLTLDCDELIVFTGVSGSGKSSLAFDTIYVEGQRRYIESLSTYARRYLGDIPKPDVESVSGLSPTISIEQKSASHNPRSTVGTLTEIYDYLRVLYARVGIPHCPISGEAVAPQSRERIIKTIQHMDEGSKIIVLSPYAKGKKAEFKDDFRELLRKGYMRVRVDGKVVDINEEISLDGNLAHDVDIVIDRLAVRPDQGSRIAEAITAALDLSKGTCAVLNVDSGEEKLFSMHAYSPKSGQSYPALEPQDFSFNSPSGMCQTCKGLGSINDFDLTKVLNPNLSIAEDCCSVGSSYQTVRYGNIYDNLARLYNFKIKTPWKKLSKEAQHVFLYGIEAKWTKMFFKHPEKDVNWVDYIHWKGVLNEARQRYEEAKSDIYKKNVEALMIEQTCPSCHGQRLQRYPAATEISGRKIAELSEMTVAECLSFFQTLTLPQTETLIAGELLKEIRERLYFLIDVGLHYLTLGRTAPTLSGGESQRVRLASQLGCGLVGVTYILDEPSIGLHPRDNKKLIDTLKSLRNKGNTVIVVEHDEETIWAADRVVDFGPGPGSRGGEIICNGSLKELLTHPSSLTGGYLNGSLKIEIPKKRRLLNSAAKKSLRIEGATHHNLKNVSVEIPLGVFVAVTGVSGSGKSSLITDILYPALSNRLQKSELKIGEHKSLEGTEHLDKVIAIDQTPIGRTPRSNPATYIKLFDDIRNLFSQLPESQIRGYKPGRFSFNVKEGACPACHGMGMIKVEMDFMADTWVECESCRSKRFDHETLGVLFKGKNIHDVLEMTVEEGLEFFSSQPVIKHKLDTLAKVGLGYMKIGQPSTTLSGGEAQRVKLGKELVRPATGKTLYILDEPTTGLHFHDIKHLLQVLHELVNRGNTVLVVEHNTDVIKTADWIIDLGPEGGGGGGQIIAKGTPEKIAKQETPTGRSVHEALFPNIKEKVALALKQSLKQKKEKKELANSSERIRSITVKGAEQHNLKCIDVIIPRDKTTIFTGPSGSGKSSLAFDTIYAEGQRRYIESLSPYARQFVKQMPKPKAQQVEGLSPAIAIEQKSHAGNPRSTVGTMTEVYDYLRILYAHMGIPHCPETGEVIKAISKEHVVERIMSYPDGEKLIVLAPITLRKQDKFEEIASYYCRKGFLRLRLNGEFFELDQEIPFDRKRKNEILLVIDRLKAGSSTKSRLYEAIENAADLSAGKIVVMREKSDVFFNLAFAVESTGKAYSPITPQSFAFNTPEGWCPDCLGLGYQYGANLIHNEDIRSLSPVALLHAIWKEQASHSAMAMALTFFEKEKIDIDLPLESLPPEKIQLLMNGSPPDKWYTTSNKLQFQWKGLNSTFAKVARAASGDIRDAMIPLLEEVCCHSCEGSRINPLARNVLLQELSIDKLCAKPIGHSLSFVRGLNLRGTEEKLLGEVKEQLLGRLEFLSEVGLQYLALDRRAPSLSNGEAQRIRLARQLGSNLTGILYVLDEPTVGLHPHDNDLLNQALQKLRKLGNTLLLVEHDPLTIAHADYILDFGPKAGEHGGHVVASGTYDQLCRNLTSLTGDYLSHRKSIPIPAQRRTGTSTPLTIKNARCNNLKNISTSFPVKALSCISGVSGSGKSTLMHDVLVPALKLALADRRVKPESITLPHATVSGVNQFEKLIVIDQNPIGTTIRSDVGTYTDILSHMRSFFASLPAAKIKGLQPKHFSYNHQRGMCSACRGLGYKRIEMHFLPAVTVLCSDCQGLKLNPISLQVEYAGKNLGQYTEHTLEEIHRIFENHPRIRRTIETLLSVGLGYLKLGQGIATLSGGEAQRLKLSRELAKQRATRTLYLIDEPTTGLHSEDILQLLKVFHGLVDKGNTLIIIEHNMDVIKNADYVVDLGPHAGEFGGEIICSGTPEEVAEHSSSYTGIYLKPLLSAPEKKQKKE